MNIKLFAMIMLMAFVAVPVFAQSQNGTMAGTNKNEASSDAAPEAVITNLNEAIAEEITEARKVENNRNETVERINRNEVTERADEDEADGDQPILDRKQIRNENRIMDSERLENQEGKPLNVGGNKKGAVKQIKSRAANEHRSAVANFVHSLLDVADRQGLGGIGKQVREMAAQQNKSEEKVTPMIERIKNKNKIRRFFFGTDFKVTKGIKDAMLQTRNRLDKLEKIKDKIIGLEDKTMIGEEIKNFRSSMEKAIKEIKAEENRFSLFGWAKRLFIR